MRFEPLHILERARRGPYVHLTLEWPRDWPQPGPGQALCLGRNVLWPLRAAHDGRLDVLTRHDMPTGISDAASVQGTTLPRPQGKTLLLAQGLGLAPLLHLCEQWHAAPEGSVLALYELPVLPPFSPRPSRFLLPAMPPGVIAAIPLLEDWGIPSRLTSNEARPGTFAGGAEELLATLADARQMDVFAFGDAAFLARIRSKGLRLLHTRCTE